MTYKDATAFAISLAATLLVTIVVFQAGDGSHGAMPAAELDGDATLIGESDDSVEAGPGLPFGLLLTSGLADSGSCPSSKPQSTSSSSLPVGGTGPIESRPRRCSRTTAGRA